MATLLRVGVDVALLPADAQHIFVEARRQRAEDRLEKAASRQRGGRPVGATPATARATKRPVAAQAGVVAVQSNNHNNHAKRQDARECGGQALATPAADSTARNPQAQGGAASSGGGRGPSSGKQNRKQQNQTRRKPLSNTERRRRRRSKLANGAAA